MILKELKYTRFEGESFEWNIQGKPLLGDLCPSVTFGQINLIVGKNATGKSRTIMSVMQLADLFSGKVDLAKLLFHSSKYEVCFQNGNGDIIWVMGQRSDDRYKVEVKTNKLIKLSLIE